MQQVIIITRLGRQQGCYCTRPSGATRPRVSGNNSHVAVLNEYTAVSRRKLSCQILWNGNFELETKDRPKFAVLHFEG